MEVECRKMGIKLATWGD